MTKERLHSAVEQLQVVLATHTYTPEQIAETAIHALYPSLSAGAANTYHRLGRGAVFMDLRDLVEGKLNTNYVPEEMLHRLHAEADMFADALAAVADYDPAHEFVAIVWQPELVMIFRLAQV